MARLLEARRIATVRQDRQLSGDDLLEDYLEHLVAPLIGIVPFPERKAFRNEVSSHIEGLVREGTSQGVDVRDATEAALLEFGEPWLVGKSFLQEWLQGTPAQKPLPLIRKASVIAFAFFGAPSFLILLLLESQTLKQPHEYMYAIIGMLAFFAPFLAGSLTGIMAPAQAERGVRNAVLFLASHSAVTGLLMLPSHEALFFAGWQAVFWLPAGKICATATASCLRHYWRQRYWQITRASGQDGPPHAIRR